MNLEYHHHLHRCHHVEDYWTHGYTKLVVHMSLSLCLRCYSTYLTEDDEMGILSATKPSNVRPTLMLTCWTQCKEGQRSLKRFDKFAQIMIETHHSSV